MAHMLDMTNDRANIAYVGKVPWHGLGEQLTEGEPLEVWAQQAGLDWHVTERALYYDVEAPLPVAVDSHKVLLRSDNQFQLGVVGDGYTPVQPREVLEFFANLIDSYGFKMDVAGSLQDGKKIWALAKTGEELRIFGQDHVASYLHLSTAFDGSMATWAMLTDLRTVCMNTLSRNVRSAETGQTTQPIVRVRHNAIFNADEVQAKLGIGQGWASYEDEVNALARRKVSDREALQFLVNVLGDPSKDINDDEQKNQHGMKHVLKLFKGDGLGSNLKSADGTAWGLVNAVTEFCDHNRKARNQSTRLNSAWYGQSAKDKARAWDEALALAA